MVSYIDKEYIGKTVEIKLHNPYPGHTDIVEGILEMSKHNKFYILHNDKRFPGSRNKYLMDKYDNEYEWSWILNEDRDQIDHFIDTLKLKEEVW